MSNHIKGGQGRDDGSIESDSVVLAFTLGIGVCLLVMLAVNAWFGGGK